jgi:hypothetical protein
MTVTSLAKAIDGPVISIKAATARLDSRNLIERMWLLP